MRDREVEGVLGGEDGAGAALHGRGADRVLVLSHVEGEDAREGLPVGKRGVHDVAELTLRAALGDRGETRLGGADLQLVVALELLEAGAHPPLVAGRGAIGEVVEPRFELGPGRVVVGHDHVDGVPDAAGSHERA